MTFISSQSASGASVTFSAIPATFGRLVLLMQGVSHNHTSNANIRVEISSDGVNFSPPVQISGNFGAAAAQDGHVVIDGYTGAVASLSAVVGAISDPGIGGTPTDKLVKCTGGISAIRLTPWAGAFDGGTMTLSGE